MEKRKLSENWRMRCLNPKSGLSDWQEAVVPGSVYTDLLRNHRIPDPYWKDNEDTVCALMEDDYEYECAFHETGMEEYSDVYLRFEGLDTLADIYLNGEYVSHAENMHRIWEYNVKHLLRDGENHLRVIFRSPLNYIAKAYKTYGNIGNDDTFEGFMHLRKAHYMFGWDWGAHLPDAGIFRPVWLCKEKGGRIESIYIRQTHEEGRCTLAFEGDCRLAQSGSYRIRITVTSPAEEVFQTVLDADGRGRIVIDQPQLWWVNGLGEQPLYMVEAVLLLDGNEIDTWKRRIGLRAMTVRREKDEWGESFAHEINGISFFAMGGDYIPEEHLLGRRSEEKTRQLLMDCKLANFNVIRVWGGGFYPDDWFYDICDELGLAVWQDFMFACSVYELTEAFEANIRQEFIDNIKRLRHHPSLALWCGNNEMEMFVEERCWVTKHTEVRDYLLMYERIIPEILKKYDPQTFYWPASPSSGGSFDEPNDPDRGDVHYWKVWHGNRPFSEYRKFYFRYLSEFGFQSFPCKKTIEAFTDDPADWNIFSYVMEKHQRNYGANGKIMNYMQQMYRYPTDFETVLYASQLLQADAIRYGVEHFRRNRGRCMGAVYWQINDCWPVISWSSIEFGGRWKALHYYAKRFFAPVMISCEEESWMTAEANMNRQHFVFPKSIRLHIANETMEEREILVKWQIRNAMAEILRAEEQTVLVPALSGKLLEKEELPELDVFCEYVSYEAWEKGKKVSEGTTIFSYPKYFRFEDPVLGFTVNGDEITVSAGAYAKSVEIQNEEQDLILSDNYFDLNGDSKTVKILRGNAEGIRVRSVYEIR
ncbi:MAG: glycoside hydrolase family 2 protein [Eubacteriales bacterium]|nr:glycoside hydrolase family 2 protein [Eubacteriales bacterium]